MQPLPSRAELLARYNYDPETGEITYRDSGRRAFASAMQGRGYLRGSIDGKEYRTHRVAWKMVYGTDPEVIDHINGNPRDNRISNLRSVSQSLNQRNRRKPKTNTSGVVGVHKHNKTGRWRARIVVEGKTIELGVFERLSDACEARVTAEAEYGFTVRHGH